MNILFITASSMNSYHRNDIYADVLHAFRDDGHEVYAISTNQRRKNLPTTYETESGIHALRVKTGNITSCGMIEKGISLLLINRQLKKAIKKYLGDIRFDLVLYVTPPITIGGAIKYVKRRDGALSYLMLKDIFPQNAVDLGMMSKKGLKSPLYRYFRKKEKQLYSVADRIGCMSEANVKYLLAHNPWIDKNIVETCPNSLNVIDKRVDESTAADLRNKYNIPLDKKVFVYGGNLGRPQGIPFIIECLRAAKDLSDIFFLVVGDGTEYGKLERFYEAEKPQNMLLMKRIPKEDYDKLVASADVGMIFLDYRFTIPNFPSRLVGYMQAGLPVLACTDVNTDVGTVAETGGFGWKCESNSVDGFIATVKKAAECDLKKMGDTAFSYLKDNYSIENSYGKIVDLLNENSCK